MKLSDIQPFNVGMMQRVGSKNDGGYVMPLYLPPIETLVSFGLGDDSNFEIDCKKKGIVNRFLVFDHSVSVGKLTFKLFRRALSVPVDFNAIVYRLKVLAVYILRFKVLRNTHFKNRVVEKSVSQGDVTLTHIAEVMVKGPFLLKIDIEGDEYKLIPQILELANRIPLAIIEFHNTYSARTAFADSIQQLKKHFGIVHFHGNNYDYVSTDGIPNTIEITFLNKKFLTTFDKVKSLPRLAFDDPSSLSKPEIKICFD